MKIIIISVGKIKEKYLLNGISEYAKRLTKYTQLDFIELKDEPAPESLSQKEQEKVKLVEGEKILGRIDQGSFVIALDLKGQQLSSEDLAEKFIEIQNYHSSNITFIIGGSLGLSEEVLKHSNYKLSFGSFTFPHQLMKLILLEQIYRAFRIINNEPYHK